jgi:hypothetical protein
MTIYRGMGEIELGLEGKVNSGYKQRFEMDPLER